MEVLERFVYSGHAVGVTAHFHKLDEMTNLDHAIPVLGSAVVPMVGGLATDQKDNYRYDVDQPRKRTLVSTEHAESYARGKEHDDRYETEVKTLVRGLDVLEKLHVDLVELRQVATSAKRAGQRTPPPVIRTTTARVEGLKLGNVKVAVELDCEPFENHGTKQEILEFVKNASDSYRREHGWRFSGETNGHVFATLVKKISLDGPSSELASMTVNENVITWDGFGKIFLGEVVVHNEERRVTMIRLKMGSDGGGSGSSGCLHSNGGTVP